MLARKWYQTQLEKIIFLQSCVRRRAARKELLILRTDAKSADHFKEVSYKLENKVVELTQTVTALKQEKKELILRVSHLETQIKSWSDRHEKMEHTSRAMETQIRESSVPQSDFDLVVLEKEKARGDHAAALENISLLNKELNDVRILLHTEKEKNETLLKIEPPNNSDEIADLKSQIVALKAQLAKSMHTRQQNASLPPTNNNNSRSRTISPARNSRHASPVLINDHSPAELEDDIKPLRQTSVLTHRKIRRNSSAEVTGNIPKTSIDQIRKAEQLNGGKNPRPLSVGQSNTLAGGKSSRLDEISDNPEDEVKNIC